MDPGMGYSQTATDIRAAVDHHQLIAFGGNAVRHEQSIIFQVATMNDNEVNGSQRLQGGGEKRVSGWRQT